MNRTTMTLGGIVIAVLAALGLVVWLAWPSAAAATELYSGTARYAVTVTIDQPRIGDTTVDITLTERDGSPMTTTPTTTPMPAPMTMPMTAPMTMPMTAPMTMPMTAPTTGPTSMPAISVEAVMPLMGFATPSLPATTTGGGHYTVSGVPLMMTGPWELHVSIGGTDDLVLPFTVTG